MYRLLPLLLVSLVYGGTQMVYYPDDNGNVIYNNKVYNVQPPFAAPLGSIQAPNRFNEGNSTYVIKQIQIPPRGTPEYQQFVTNAISTGLIKLTMAVNKVIKQQSRNQYNNIVFAPVSMAGMLKLANIIGFPRYTFLSLINYACESG